MVTLEFISRGMRVEHSLFVDKFSILMALIVGIIGSAICLYVVGYIPEYYAHHKKLQDRRNYFAFLMYLFLSAMFGIIFSNNLKWLLFFLGNNHRLLVSSDRLQRRQGIPNKLLPGAEHEPGRRGGVRCRPCLPLFLLRGNGTGQAAAARQGGGSCSPPFALPLQAW